MSPPKKNAIGTCGCTVRESPAQVLGESQSAQATHAIHSTHSSTTKKRFARWRMVARCSM